MLRFTFILLMLVSSCATTANYEKVLHNWVGHNVSELVASWGTPFSAITLPDGTRAYKFVNLNCNTTFITNAAGLIQKWQYEGQGCRCT